MEQNKIAGAREGERDLILRLHTLPGMKMFYTCDMVRKVCFVCMLLPTF